MSEGLPQHIARGNGSSGWGKAWGQHVGGRHECQKFPLLLVQFRLNCKK